MYINQDQTECCSCFRLRSDCTECEVCSMISLVQGFPLCLSDALIVNVEPYASGLLPI